MTDLYRVNATIAARSSLDRSSRDDIIIIYHFNSELVYFLDYDVMKGNLFDGYIKTVYKFLWLRDCMIYYVIIPAEIKLDRFFTPIIC